MHAKVILWFLAFQELLPHVNEKDIIYNSYEVSIRLANFYTILHMFSRMQNMPSTGRQILSSTFLAGSQSHAFRSIIAVSRMQKYPLSYRYYLLMRLTPILGQFMSWQFCQRFAGTLNRRFFIIYKLNRKKKIPRGLCTSQSWTCLTSFGPLQTRETGPL